MKFTSIYHIIIWMENLVLKVQDLSLKYFGGYKGVDMVSFETNDSIAILGKKLSGKTSLLRCIANLEKYDGKIELNTINIVFTFDLKSLKKSKSVSYNIAYPLILRKEPNVDEKVLKIAKVLKIDSILNKSVKELSISEQRLVILARAFVRDADLYLLDNPLKDVDNREEYFEILKGLMKDKFVIYATDDVKEAESFNKILCMAYQKAIGFGSKEEILSRPKTIDVLKLFTDYKFENIELKKDGDKYYIEYLNIKYDVPSPISEIYNGKEVVFAIDGEKIILNMYFDKSTEYLISRD